MTRHLRNLRTAIGLVFSRPLYAVLAAVLAILTFLLAVWLPNFELLFEILSGSNTPLAHKFSFALNLLGGITTNFSLFSATYTIAIAILFGLVVSMIAYLLKQRRGVAAGQNIALGSGAMASGALGVGCAACGSLIVSAAVPSLGATAGVAALPLNGGEFGILSVVLLSVSLFLISRTIATVPVCGLPGDAHTEPQTGSTSK